jgi:hypothetical protein
MNLTGRGVEPKQTMYVSKKLRDFAKGKTCTMQSAWCNRNPETTVLCHARRGSGAGMAQKPHDFWAYHGCSDCHAAEEYMSDGDLMQAIRRTQYRIHAEFGTLTL